MKKLEFKTAFEYPFNRAIGMWNILWMLVPIVGWLALGGYSIRIIQEFSKDKFKQLPIFKFRNDLESGFFMLIKATPFIIVYITIISVLGKISLGAMGLINFFLSLFVVPVLGINFVNKKTVGSFFEFKILKSVFDNLGDYLVAVSKSILLGIIFFLMWIVLVGFPAGVFTKNIFLVDFYRRKVK